MADPAEVSVAELQARVVALEEERHKLQRINQALIGRIESSAAQSDEAYGAFQYSVVLAEQVRERTDALSQTMLELKASNQLLSDARLRAETAHQHLLDAIESISDAFVCSIRSNASCCSTSASARCGSTAGRGSVLACVAPNCTGWRVAAG